MVDLTEVLCRITKNHFYDLFRIFETASNVPASKQAQFLSCLPSYKARLVEEIFELGGADYLLQVASQREGGRTFGSLNEVGKHYKHRNVRIKFTV